MAAATEHGTAAPPEHSQQEALQQEPLQKEPVQKEPAKLQVIHVYQHSNFFYWWIMWAYGFFCALVTY